MLRPACPTCAMDSSGGKAAPTQLWDYLSLKESHCFLLECSSTFNPRGSSMWPSVPTLQSHWGSGATHGWQPPGGMEV